MMATATKQTSVLIICDSRGSDLQWHIDQLSISPFSIKVMIYSGKGIIEAVRSAKAAISWRAPSILIIQNGICDVTKLDRSTRLVSLAHNSYLPLVQEYKESMDIASHFIKILLDGMECKVVFAHIVGMDMAKWNNQPYPHPQQELLDSAIHNINIEINCFNSERNAVTPWLARDVHHNNKGRHRTRYNRLAEDGVHLSDYLKPRWALEFVSAITKNHEKMVH